MAIRNGTDGDAHARLIHRTLVKQYGSRHPQARIDVNRYNPACIRIRIIDADFRRKSRSTRVKAVRQALESLPEETAQQVWTLFLFTPEEAETSLMNVEFEHPALPQR